MTHTRQLALAALPLVLLTACGGSDEEKTANATERQAYIDTSAASMTASPDLPFDAATATCIATAVVDVIGADALVRADVTPEEFAGADTYAVLADDVPDDDAAAQLREDLDGCDSAAGFSSAFVDALGVEVAPEDVACVADGVDRAALNDAMAEGFLAATDEAGRRLEETTEAALLDAVVGCPGVVSATFLAEVPGPVTPETEACVAAVVAADPERVRAAFGGDEAAIEALGTEIGTSCAAGLGG